MSFKLRPAVEDDCIHISRIAKAAFPRMSAILFPAHLRTEENQEDEVTWRATRTLARMKNGVLTVVAVEVDEKTGAELNIVAFSQWQKPRSPNEQVQSLDQVDQTSSRPSGMDKRASEEILEVVHNQEARILGESASDTWSEFRVLVYPEIRPDKILQVCLLLAVHPAYHRRGLGTRVLRWGLDQAAAEGKRAFVTSSKKGRDLYVSQGMREVGVDVVWGEEPHYAMITGRACGTLPDEDKI